jgi:SAM-dependent methyltransferase
MLAFVVQMPAMHANVDLWDDRVFYDATRAAYGSPNAVTQFKTLLLPERKRQLLGQFEHFLSMLPAGGRVLDVGCGTGKDVGKLLNLGFDAEGIDISPAMIEIACAEIHSRFQCLDARDIGTLPASSYDGVCCVAVLQHITPPDLHRVFGGINSILRRPGHLFIFTKRGRGRAWDTRLGESFKRATAFYGIKQLERALCAHGFSIVRSSKFALVRRGRRDNWLTITAAVSG